MAWLGAHRSCEGSAAAELAEPAAGGDGTADRVVGVGDDASGSRLHIVAAVSAHLTAGHALDRAPAHAEGPAAVGARRRGHPRTVDPEICVRWRPHAGRELTQKQWGGRLRRTSS